MNVFIKAARDALFSLKMKMLNEHILTFHLHSAIRILMFFSHNIIYYKLIYVAPTMQRSHLYVMKLVTLSRFSGIREISLPTHLVFISIVNVVQVQIFNLMSGDKVLTPCWNELSKQGLKYQAAYMIAYWFPCVPNHNRVVAFHIMFIITTVTAH